ncbi:MAG: rhomboid family intramembrane serine protease [Porticoccaceae bacterium]
MSPTLILIAITVAISWAAWQRPVYLDKLIYHGPSVERGQYWRMLSHGFIHGDGNHLLFNMITLYFFGRVMEQILIPRIGVGGFFGFYLFAIVFAMIPSHLRNRHNPAYRSLGASGAVSAVLFSYILIQPWAMLFVMFIPVPAIIFAVLYVAYSLWAERRGRDRINHSAHLWGALWGVGFMIFLQPSLATRFFAQLRHIPGIN